ncbi:MAG: CDP-archaeol synthase [Ruminococcaceae bacterium]|nr:CDP-archaeol synthase [Oscillospiraceae bacterium]
MKARLISAAVGILLAVVVFTLNVTKAPWLLSAMVALIACISLHEILVATGFMKNKGIVLTCYGLTIFTVCIPFFPQHLWADVMAAACAVYFFVMFFILLASHKKVQVERVALAMMVTAMVAMPYYSMLYMYWTNRFDSGEYKYVGQSLIILCFLISWMTDTGAFFSGKLFGKHKLAPNISPKKTWEGAIGGFIFCVLAVSGVAYLLTGPLNILTFEVNWVYLLIITAVGSVISMIGDLSFSVIKRAFNIKDFGNIMPGHGGVLDRFDSALFVCPVLCLFNSAFPVIIVLS